MMSRKIALSLLAFWSASWSWAQTPVPAWVVIASDSARRIELDAAGVQRVPDGQVTATSRLVMAREVQDTQSGEVYRYIQTLSRYHCQKRTTATLRRSFVNSNGEVLRTDEIPNPPALPVRSGTLDHSVMRELCRPMSALPKGDLRMQLARIRAAANARLSTLPKSGQGSVTTGQSAQAPQAEVVAPLSKPEPTAAKKRKSAVPSRPSGTPSLCTEGRRQSPIEIRDSVWVDLEPILFSYREAPFTISDMGETLEVVTSGSQLTLLGKTYGLERIRFYRPSSDHVEGQRFVMSAHLEHRASDGERLIVALLLDQGEENREIQALWNYLPLEKNQPVRSPMARIDLNRLLPVTRGYHIYMGSLPYPPCTEGVVWVVLQTPVSISPEQEAVFARLYPNNARATQPAHGRLIKSSRPFRPEWSGIDDEARQGDVPANGR